MKDRIKLSADFYADEFESPDTRESKMQPEFITKLQRLRSICGWQFFVKSGYRTPAYNKKLGGEDNSYHVQGMAADISHKGWTGIQRYKFVSAALSLGLSVGVYDAHFHVDNRMEPRVLWIGKSK
jgi:uncharacterized protein YcbK (DUF882 family)